MKTTEELNGLKKEYEELTTELNELSEEELNEVAGGLRISSDRKIVEIINTKEFELKKAQD